MDKEEKNVEVGIEKDDGWKKKKIEKFFKRKRCEIGRDMDKKIIEKEEGSLRFKREGIEKGNIKKNEENGLKRLKRGIDIEGKLDGLRKKKFLRKRSGIKERRVERLKNVMERRRKKESIEKIGLLWGGLRERKIIVKMNKLRCKVDKEMIKNLRWFMENKVGLKRGSDVGKGGEKDKIRNRIGIDLENIEGRFNGNEKWEEKGEEREDWDIKGIKGDVEEMD